MQELTIEEITIVSAAGPMTDFMADLKSAIESVPGVYNSAINSMTDLMCRASSKC